MPLSGCLLAILLSFAVTACGVAGSKRHSEEQASGMPYAAAPVIPVADDVRFFERPALLSALQATNLPMPEAVLLESDPWNRVLGSGSPHFALYEDGYVIYLADGGYRSVQLNPDELRSFRKSLSAAQNPGLSGGYRVALATDQPDNALLLYRDRPIYLSVYGSLDDREVMSRLPRPVREAFKMLRSFRHEKSEPWMPEKIEVMIWPYEYAPEPSIRWKKNWAGLSDPETVRRGDSYSLFLPSTELPTLNAFLAKRNPRGAVEIDGRKWAVSIRIPFPQERLWMAPNPEVYSSSD